MKRLVVIALSLFSLALAYTMKKPGRLSAYSFNNCVDPAQENLAVSQLILSPDPIPNFGGFYVTLKAEDKKVIDSPLKASIQLYKEVASSWLKVPCVGEVGSCQYDDFCKILDQIDDCPQPFIDNNVPCQCPFTVGNYSIVKGFMDYDLSVLPSGGYRGIFNFTEMGCYNITFTLQ